MFKICVDSLVSKIVNATFLFGFINIA